jgi:hypothetical protein
MDHYDIRGRAMSDIERQQIDAMHFPVRCAYCSKVYDLGTVEVTARYADCSMWKSPCCGLTVDDRGETGWKSKKDYYPIKRGA